MVKPPADPALAAVLPEPQQDHSAAQPVKQQPLLSPLGDLAIEPEPAGPAKDKAAVITVNQQAAAPGILEAAAPLGDSATAAQQATAALPAAVAGQVQLPAPYLMPGEAQLPAPNLMSSLMTTPAVDAPLAMAPGGSGGMLDLLLSDDDPPPPTLAPVIPASAEAPSPPEASAKVCMLADTRSDPNSTACVLFHSASIGKHSVYHCLLRH